jgi:hypothetical protein
MTERELLIEQVASAWRPSDADGGPRSHPAWHDLDVSGRAEAFEVAARLRRLEAALDARGLSTTAHAVLERIRTARR